MAYSILKSEYPGCTFHRINGNCTIVKRQGISVGFSYRTALYVLMNSVLFINPCYYSATTAHHRTALLRSMDNYDHVNCTAIEISSNALRLLAEDVLNYDKPSLYIIRVIARAWSGEQRSLQELKKALDDETKKSQKLQSKLDKLHAKLQGKGGK